MTLKREEESNPQKKDLMDKLVKIMDDLWETESIYTESIYKELTTQAQGTGQTLQKMKKGTLSLYLAVFLDVPGFPNQTNLGSCEPLASPTNKADTIPLGWMRFLSY